MSLGRAGTEVRNRRVEFLTSSWTLLLWGMSRGPCRECCTQCSNMFSRCSSAFGAPHGAPRGLDYTFCANAVYSQPPLVHVLNPVCCIRIHPRVCCNALLAAYARATPPQWVRALKLLELMHECGGELTPDIVSYNTVMKACGNAHQVNRAFKVGGRWRVGGGGGGGGGESGEHSPLRGQAEQQTKMPLPKATESIDSYGYMVTTTHTPFVTY